MATPDISVNPFYTLMTDPTKGQREKHDALVNELILMGNGPQKQAYDEFRDFLRLKQGAIDDGITDAKKREAAMELELSYPIPNQPKIQGLSDKQADELGRLLKGNGQIEDILSTMFSAEGAASTIHTPTTDTSGLYFEVQSQTRILDALVESNGNTLGELNKLSNGTFVPAKIDPLVAPFLGPANDNSVGSLPDLTPVVNRVFVPEEFGKTQQAIVAPAKAEFKKRPPRV